MEESWRPMRSEVVRNFLKRMKDMREKACFFFVSKGVVTVGGRSCEVCEVRWEKEETFSPYMFLHSIWGAV